VGHRGRGFIAINANALREIGAEGEDFGHPAGSGVARALADRHFDLDPGVRRAGLPDEALDIVSDGPAGPPTSFWLYEMVRTVPCAAITRSNEGALTSSGVRSEWRLDKRPACAERGGPDLASAPRWVLPAESCCDAQRGADARSGPTLTACNILFYILSWCHSGLTPSKVFLNQLHTMIDVSIMKTKTATVADLRNNFRRVSAWLENGESVEIIKRGRHFARLMPVATSPSKPAKIDFTGQLRAVWGEKVFTTAEVQGMRDAELGSQS